MTQVAENDQAHLAAWVRVPAMVGKQIRSFPLVITADPKLGARPCELYLHWARAQVRYDLIEPAARAWSSFLTYLGVAHSQFPVQGDDLSHLVGSYLLVRHSGTATSPSPDVRSLRWRPSLYNVLKRELALIASILQLASTQLGYVNLGLAHFKAPEVSASLRELSDLNSSTPAELNDDFFLHLRAARIHWAKVHGRHELQLPSLIRRSIPSKTVWHCFSTDEIWEIVGREKNPMFRALWLAGGFGGLRISEQLNAFQIDILPAGARAILFPGIEEVDDTTILYLRAHPAETRYTGSLTSFSMTRREYLAVRYGFAPRSELALSPDLRSLAAGWKGTVPSGHHGLHQVMWCSDEAARAFAACMGEIRDIHLRHKTSLRHPWLFVNTGDTDHFGDPLKMSRVKKAFEAACTRVNIIPYVHGRNLHGLRHHYDHVLRNVLGLDDRHVQIAMGHRTISSQAAYVTKIVEAHTALRAAARG